MCICGTKKVKHMKKKTLGKALGIGMLAVSLFISPLTGISARAAEGDAGSKAGDKKEKLDPTRTETGKEGRLNAFLAKRSCCLPPSW